MITGHTFDRYQEMYQKAIKIARVLDEVEGENKAVWQMKRKFGYVVSTGQGSGNPKRVYFGRPQDKGKQPVQWQTRTTCAYCNRFHLGPCRMETTLCYRCEKMGHWVASSPKANWNKQTNVQGPRPRTQHASFQERTTATPLAQETRNFRKM